MPFSFGIRRKQSIDDHTLSGKHRYCPGCGEEKTMRWPTKGQPSSWCSQRCAACAASRMLAATHVQPLLYCVYCGNQGCGTSVIEL